MYAMLKGLFCVVSIYMQLVLLILKVKSFGFAFIAQFIVILKVGLAY